MEQLIGNYMIKRNYTIYCICKKIESQWIEDFIDEDTGKVVSITRASYYNQLYITPITYESVSKLDENDIKDLKVKLEFIEETGADEFDENVFKAYKTLKLIENKKLSALDKAKLIGKLIEE